MPRLDAHFTTSDDFQGSPFGAVYEGLRGEGYKHAVAMWGAWLSHPAGREELGLPRFAVSLATELGISDRTLRGYKKRFPEVLAMAQSMARDSVLGNYRLGALKAMGKSAGETEGRHSAADRRMLFTMTGDLVEAVDVTTGGEKLPKTGNAIALLQAARQAAREDDDDG